ncbi:MAG: TOBE domain-containing protein [Actinomycetaceae bacterium]|nr:TOBE domain-containing protein [Actinomycetaceae bacterium]
MPLYRISTIAHLLGVSNDTVRRWIDDGYVTAHKQPQEPTKIDGNSVVDFINKGTELVHHDDHLSAQSIRNHMHGLVTNIISDRVMSQVEMQCGRYRIVSLISTEAVNELGLEVGSIAIAQIKATNVSLHVFEGDKL